MSCSSGSGKVSAIKDAADQNATKPLDDNKSNEANETNNSNQNNANIDDSAASQTSFGKVYVNEVATGKTPPSPSSLDDLLK